VEDYTISETTLEQVFLSFAKAQPANPWPPDWSCKFLQDYKITITTVCKPFKHFPWCLDFPSTGSIPILLTDSCWFLGAFIKLQRVTITFIMSVCLSVCLPIWLHGITQVPLDRFSWNLMFVYFF
jgi:hypothetical protein